MSRLIFSINEKGINKEKLMLLKKEAVYLLIALIASIILFKIAFYNETLINVIKTVASLFWLFILPGYFIMLYWEKSLDFLERIIIGTALGVGLGGILSYYLGLFGLHIKYSAIVLPLFLICLGLLIFLKSPDKNAGSSQ